MAPIRPRLAAALALLALPAAGCASLAAAAAEAEGAAPPGRVPAAEAPPAAAARFEVLGRAPVTATRTTTVAVVRTADGRTVAYTGTFGRCGGCFGNRVYAWDVTDPAAPALTDSVVVDSRSINAIDVNDAGTLAVVTRVEAESRRNGVVLLDLSDPAHPRPLSEYWETVTGGVQNAVFAGEHLFVADLGTGELAIVDVDDPRDPREVGRWGVPPTEGYRFLADVSVRDGIAYLSYWDDGLVMLDVGNGIKGGTVERPRVVSRFRYRTEWRGQRYGNTAHAVPYTNAAGRRYVFVGDLIFPERPDWTRRIQTGGYVHVLDVRNPEAPVEVATYEVPGHGVNRFWVEDDVLYVAAFGGGLRAVDVSGELRGSLQGRELAALETTDARSAVPGVPMTFAAAGAGGLVYATDMHAGLWIARLVRE